MAGSLAGAAFGLAGAAQFAGEFSADLWIVAAATAAAGTLVTIAVSLLPARLLTALDNVIAPVLPYRTGWDKRDRGRKLLAAVGLAGREQSLPSRMSGGEQQRVAIARALINAPSLLLADEATGNLDSQNASDILNLLSGLRQAGGMTIIIATHDPQIAARCERLIRLRDGAAVDDIDLADGYRAEETLRRVGQLG
jgi:putative ABC transport system ATP-binding protein